MRARHLGAGALGAGALGALAAATLMVGCASGSDVPAASSTSPSATRPGMPEASTDAGETFVVTDFGADTVTFVGPSRHREAAGPDSVKVGTAPYGIALGGDGTAWVATAEGVAAVDTATRRRTALIPYSTYTGPVTTGEYRGGGMRIALSVPAGRPCPGPVAREQ
ncbi:hypothetical protein GCM10014715_48320 [Streptomyces spiralis]|uniref:Lipoprotein n=2 Tax=Streptomyces spiralis TaxID=66376 RepID=A0A919A3T2_9ACTN|nr:hypothetical protein GCM10014715_48320 [Streptomyces spiralis]